MLTNKPIRLPETEDNLMVNIICQRNTAPIVKLEMILSRDIFSKL